MNFALCATGFDQVSLVKVCTEKARSSRSMDLRPSLLPADHADLDGGARAAQCADGGLYRKSLGGRSALAVGVTCLSVAWPWLAAPYRRPRLRWPAVPQLRRHFTAGAP